MGVFTSAATFCQILSDAHRCIANCKIAINAVPVWPLQDRWLPSWLTGCEISAPIVKKAQHVLRYTVGTWDVLRMTDGRRLVGDFKDIEPLDIEPRRTAVFLAWA